MKEAKFERRTLKVEFTAVETHELATQLATKTRELSALEEEKASVTKQYGAKVAEAKAATNKLANLVNDGYEYREVECEVLYHFPEKGKKTYIRKDNGKQFVEKMESFEWNLFNQAEEDEMSGNSTDDYFEDVEIIKETPLLPQTNTSEKEDTNIK
jgi:uncharacterized protein (UPF0216 family)